MQFKDDLVAWLGSVAGIPEYIYAICGWQQQLCMTCRPADQHLQAPRADEC